MSKTARKALWNAVAIIMAVSLVFLQWPISSKALADAAEEVQERLEASSTVDVPLAFEHAYITYADQTIAEPATKVTLPTGSDFEFEAIPDSGYQVESVTATIDGTDTKVKPGKNKRYKLTASEVVSTDLVRIRAITAPTVEDSTVEVAQEAEPVAAVEPAQVADEPSPVAAGNGESSEESSPVKEDAATADEGVSADEGAPAKAAVGDAGETAGADTQADEPAAGEEKAPQADSASDEVAAPSADEAPAPAENAQAASEDEDVAAGAGAPVDVATVDAATLSSLASNVNTELENLLGVSFLAVPTTAVTPITSANAVVDVAMYPTDADRRGRVNALTSDYEVSVSETLYGSVHFDFNPGEGPTTGRLTYTYRMPDNIVAADKARATLYDEAGNVAGTWEIADNTVYFYYDEPWALAHPNGGGDFNFDFTLDEETTTTGEDNTFSFPGATETITVKVKDAEMTGSKTNAGVEEGGFVTYTVNLHAQADFPVFTFSDELGASLSYVEGSFTIDGSPLDVVIADNGNGTHTATAGSRVISKGDHVITYRAKIDEEKFNALANWGTLDDAHNVANWEYGSDGDLKYGSADTWLWVQKNLINKWSGALWDGYKVLWTIQVNGSDQYKVDLAGYTVSDDLPDGMSWFGHFNVLNSSWKQVDQVKIPEGATSFTYTFPDDAGSNTYYIQYYTCIDDIGAIVGQKSFDNTATITPPSGTPPTSVKVTYTYGTAMPGKPDEGVKPEPEVTKEVADQKNVLATGVVSWHSTLVSDVYPEPEQTSGLVLQYYDSLQNWNNQLWENGKSQYYKIWFAGEPELYVNGKDGTKLVKGVDYQFDEKGGATYGFTSHSVNFDGDKVPVAYRIRFILDSPTMSQVVANKTPIDIYYDTQCDGTYQQYYNEGRARITKGNSEVYGKSVTATYEMAGSTPVTKLSDNVYWDDDIKRYVFGWTVYANRDRYDQGKDVSDLHSPYLSIIDNLPEGMTVIPDSITANVVRPNPWLQWNPAAVTCEQDGRVATFDIDLTKAPLESWQVPFYDESGSCYAGVELKFKTALDPAYVVHDGTTQTIRNTALFEAGGIPLGSGHTTATYSDSVISKTGSQNEGEPVVHYTIRVNDKGQKLDADETHTTVNLKDTLDYRSTVVLSSIRVTDPKTNEDITNQCTVTLSNSEEGAGNHTTSSFTINVPDSRSLVIAYDVRLSGNPGESFEVTNSATLNGITNKQTQNKQWFKVNHADASVYGSNTSIAITKTDSSNVVAQSARLAGAVFELYSVDLGKLPDGPVTNEGLAEASTLVNTVTTDGNGSAVLVDEYTKAIQYDTLYYFKEVRAPFGYAIDDPNPHFVMTQGSNYSSQNALAEAHGIYPSPNTVYNVTDTAKTTTLLKARKVFAGGDLKAGDFTFELRENGELVETTTNDADGNVAFKNIEYDAAGTHTYTIAEVPGDNPGIAYDANIATVVVQVTKGDNGRYVAEATYADGGDEAVFTNTYSAKAEARLAATKTLNGEAPEAGAFSFTLSGRDGDIQTVSNDEKGAITFAPIAYDASTLVFDGYDDNGDRYAEFTYTIRENVPEGASASRGGSAVAQGMVYDAAPRSVVVRVTDSGTGQLYVTYDGEQELSGIEFSNSQKSVDVSGVKSWDDDNNREGLRPEAVTVRLLANGEETGKTATASAENGWTFSFVGLDAVDADGNAVVYSVAENGVEGYVSTISGSMSDGFTITNKRVPETVEIPVRKVWDDAENRDGVRLKEVTVKLLADGKEVEGVAPLTLSEANNWSDKFTDRPKYAGGREIVYTVEEVTAVSPAYEKSVSGSVAEGFVITNKHVPEVTTVSGTKSWHDNNNVDGNRPTSVTVHLFADNAEVRTTTATEAGGWSYEFAGLPVYKEGSVGKKINYTVTESDFTGYVASVVAGGLVNTYERDTTQVRVTKSWDDADDRDGVRPDAVTVQLRANGEVRDAVELSAASGWTYVWGDLPKRMNGADVTYTVTEPEVEGYELAATSGNATTGFVLTNKHVPEKGEAALTLRKVSAADGDEKLTGAQFTLTDVSDPSKTEVVATNSDGVARFEKLFSGHAYTLQETAAPGGFKLDDTVYHIEVGSGENPEVTCADGLNVQHDGTVGYWALVKNQPEGGSGSLVLKKEFGWDYTDSSGAYAGNNLGGKGGVDTGAAGIILSNITFTLTGKNSGEVYTIVGDGFDRTAPMPVVSASGDSTISVVYSGRQWTITNLPYDTYTVVESSDGYRDNGAEIDTVLHKFYTTGAFEVTKDAATTNVSVGNTTGTRGEGVSETGATVDVNGSDAEVDVLNIYYRPKVVEVTKAWNIPEGFNYTPHNIDVQLVRSINGVDNNGTWQQGYFHPVLPEDVPEHPDYETRKTLHWNSETKSYDKAVFSMLPAVTANGEQITYEVREVRADESLVPMVNGAYTDEAGNVLADDNLYIDADGTTATVTWGDGSDVAKNPYNDVDGVQRYYSSSKGIGIKNTIEATSVSGVKTWDDSNNQDNVRPDSVTVRLLANGKEYAHTEATAAGDWRYTFDNLPKYLNGEEVEYSVEEVSVPGYTSKVSGYNIENARETEKTSVTATKVWDDGNNRDNKRPTSIHLQLMGADGAYGEPVELNDANKWTYTWNDLPKNREGKQIAYSVVELDVPNEYKVSYSGDASTGLTVTDSYAPGVTSVSVAKAWEDRYDQDRVRPESVRVQLYANDVAEGSAVELSDENGWSYTWVDLPKMAGGVDIAYTVSEVKGAWSSRYDSEQTGDAESGYVITNTHNPATTSVSGIKVWDDENNQDNKRPDSITVRLLADSVEVNHADVTDADDWSFSFENLPKYAAGQEISYTVIEDEVGGYDYVVSYGADSEEGVLKCRVTNTHVPETTSKKVVKAWDDEEDYDGLRPSAVTVQLYADGQANGDPVTLSERGGWSHTWTDLPKYADRHEIAYTVAEVENGASEAYTSGEPVYDEEQDAFVITNTHEVVKVDVSGVKVWDDANDQDRKRPESITVDLLADGSKVDQQVVKKADDGTWSFEFSDLDKYADGHEIVYTVAEEQVKGYDATISGTVSEGFTITNAYEPEKTEVSVAKTWDDADNQDAIRPDSIKVRLLADGKLASGEGVTPEIVLSEANGWEHVWTDLDRYASGNEIVYTVEEDAVVDYASQVSGSATSGFTFKNTHVPNVVDVQVDKVWDDADNQDGKRAESVEVQLNAKIDGETIAIDGVEKRVTLSAANGWHYEWTGLPQKRGGKVISYTLDELSAVDGYTGEVTSSQTAATDTAHSTISFIVTNSHPVELIDIPVSKIWKDATDQDRIRPSEIVAQLYAGDDPVLVDGVPATAVLNESNSWSHTFTGLPKYAKGAEGAEVAYRVVEAAVPNGYTLVSEGTKDNGYTMTNAHTPEVTSVSVTKEWDDADNQDNKRPASVTVQLNGPDGACGDPVVLSSDNGWTHTWEGLALNHDGSRASYSVVELDVPNDYTAEVAGDAANGFTVKNSYTPGVTSVSVVKVWDDGSNQDNIRPSSIAVQLYADGVATGEPVSLDNEGDWAHTWDGLPQKKAGVDIVYTVKELGNVPGYTTATEGDAATGFTITNTHAPEETQVSATKEWRDGDNQDRIRSDSVKVQLYADGDAVGDAVTLDAGNNWTCTWSGLAKKENGNDIVYTVSELDTPEGYELAVEGDAASGFTLVNTHVPDVTAVQVSKVWDDAGNQDNKRPAEVSVQLLANNGAYGEPITLSAANGWHYAWTDLPLRQDGQVIEYSVAEAGVPDDYTASVSGDRESGFVITNSYTPGVTSVTVSKAWDDANNQDRKRPGSVKVRLLADGKQVSAEGVPAEIELNEDNHWTYTWEGLDQMKAGVEIAYTVEELDVPDIYSTATSGSADEGFVITNTYVPETTEIEVTKTWDDDNDRDGVRPEGVAITLFANGENKATQTIVPDENGVWSYTFTNLPKYADGVEIEYSISEQNVDGYTGSIDGFTVSNAHDNALTEVSGTKYWVDNGDQDGMRPASVTVNLLADGVKVDSKVVTEADDWSYSFTGLTKYRDGGKLIEYTVAEDEVARYDSAVAGYDITNTLRVGSLKVSKSVANAPKPGVRFAFTVMLDDMRVQGAHGGMAFVDGVATFELADGDSVEAFDLPEGVRYVVIEKDTPGYEAVAHGATSTIVSETEAEASFTNTYNATADVDFYAMKTLDGRTLNAEEFAFELLEDGEVIQTVANAGDGHARFDTITYTTDDLGEHSYRIREVPGEVNGVTYDEGVCDFIVNVSDNGDGTLSVAYDGYNPDNGATFTNTYVPSGKVTLVTSKRLDGAVPAAGAYEFQLADSSGRVIATASNAADGSVTFPELTFKAAGTYEYFISEVVPEGAQKLGNRVVYDGVFYDLDESAVTIEAIDNFDGTLRFATTYDDGAPKTFENETAPAANFPLTATKAITGRDFREGDEFTFTVDVPEGAPAPERTSVTVRPADGSKAEVSFGDITFTTADLGNTYTYTVHEEGAGETTRGITNDPFAHTVSLTVGDAGDGTMSVTAAYGNDADGMVFTNAYAARGAIALGATKTLAGRALADNEFFFELEGDDLPGVLHANAAADGSITFPPLEFTQEDVGHDFHYTMRETQGTLGGVTYDTREHEVTVHVADNGDGTLGVTADYGAAGAAPVFENTYRAEDTSVQLSAHKALEGGALEADAFSFELRGVSENAVGTRQVVTNDESGAVAFDAIEYSAAGTYEYRIAEVVPADATDNGDGTFTGADGIIYDGTAHTARVTVVDDGYGKLVASVDYDDGASGISFGNIALVRTGFTFDKYYFGGVGSFDFTLTATDADGAERSGDIVDYSNAATIVDDGSQAFTATVQNGAFADGMAKITFPEIGFAADGDYYYLIEENETDTADMVADKAQYLAHVVVSGGQVASTTFDLIYEGENLGETTDLAFYNNSAVTLGFNSLSAQSYTGQGERVSVYPKAKKFLNDSTDQLVGGEFTFELIDEATGSVIAVATNDEVGNIAFFDEGSDPGLAYDEPGTFRYTIREVAGDEADMVYDTSTILLTVDVVDTDEGLQATMAYNGPGGGEPAFYNVKRGMDVTVQKVSRFGGEGLADCTYALWMVGEGGDALVQEATSDAQGYITFKDVSLIAGQKYYFKEVEAPKGHTVDPYRTAYFSLNAAGDKLVLVENTAADGWHSATEHDTRS